MERVIRDNNITRKRTRVRHYPETRYNNPIDAEIEYKELKKSFHKAIRKIESMSLKHLQKDKLKKTYLKSQ